MQMKSGMMVAVQQHFRGRTWRGFGWWRVLEGGEVGRCSAAGREVLVELALKSPTHTKTREEADATLATATRQSFSTN